MSLEVEPAPHRITASKIALGRRCLYWARPDVTLPAQGESAAAELGTALHSVAEAEVDAEDPDEADVATAFAELVGGTAEADAGSKLTPSAREKLGELAAAWRAWWAEGRVTGAETEVIVALGDGEGRRLRAHAQRDYSDAFPWEIPGTADLVGVWAVADGSKSTLCVFDYKTGRGPHKLADHVDQLVHLGTALAREEGFDCVRVGVIHVTPDGVFLDSREIGSLEMEIDVQEMAAMIAQVPGAEPRPGLYCADGYCGAKAICPATLQAIERAAPTAIASEDTRRHLPVMGPVESNEQALAVLVAAPMIEAWIAERVKAAKAYADANGGVQHDGKTYRARAVKRETPMLEVKGAVDVLRRELGDRADEAIVTKTSASFTSITKVLRTRFSNGVSLKDQQEAVREALREAGALKVSEFQQYEWKKEK